MTQKPKENNGGRWSVEVSYELMPAQIPQPKNTHALTQLSHALQSNHSNTTTQVDEEQNKFTNLSNEELIQKYEGIQRWVNSGICESSINQYLKRLKRFCDWIGKDPDALKLEKIEQSLNPKKVGDLEAKIRLYLKELEEKRGLARNTVHSHMTAIRSFFSWNFITLGKLRLVRIYPFRSNEKSLTIEDVRKIIYSRLVCSRNKAIWGIKVPTGLRNKPLALLTYGDIKENFEKILRGESEPPLEIWIRPEYNKNNAHEADGFWVFVNEDGIVLLDKYLNERRAKGEKILPSSPFFINNSNHINYPQEVRPINGDIITKAIREDAIKLGIAQQKTASNGKKYWDIRAHSTVKLFNRVCRVNEVSDNTRLTLLGKKLSKSEEPYQKPPKEELREVFVKKIEPHLSIGIAKEMKKSINGKLAEKRRILEQKFEEIKGEMLGLPMGELFGEYSASVKAGAGGG